MSRYDREPQPFTFKPPVMDTATRAKIQVGLINASASILELEGKPVNPAKIQLDMAIVNIREVESEIRNKRAERLDRRLARLNPPPQPSPETTSSSESPF